MNVVQDEGVVASTIDLLLLLPVVVDEAQEQIEGIDQLPPQKVVGEGCEERQDHEAGGAHKPEEANVYPTELEVKVKQLPPLLSHGKRIDGR